MSLDARVFGDAGKATSCGRRRRQPDVSGHSTACALIVQSPSEAILKVCLSARGFVIRQMELDLGSGVALGPGSPLSGGMLVFETDVSVGLAVSGNSVKLSLRGTVVWLFISR